MLYRYLPGCILLLIVKNLHFGLASSLKENLREENIKRRGRGRNKEAKGKGVEIWVTVSHYITNVGNYSIIGVAFASYSESI